MPPTFAYVIALFNYVAVAGFGLAVCLVFALLPATRVGAKRVAGGILGSFPGVFLFQLLVLPIAGPVLLTFSVFYGDAVQPDVEPPHWIRVVAAFLTVDLFAIASLTGFVVGWAVGSRVADGMPLRQSVRASRILATLFRIVGLDRGEQMSDQAQGKTDAA